jgi:hypothetical protein
MDKVGNPEEVEELAKNRVRENSQVNPFFAGKSFGAKQPHKIPAKLD